MKPSLQRGDVRGAILGLAGPVFAATVGDQLLGLADTIVIGTLGADALAAVTAASSVFIVLAMTLHGLTQGAGILAAQAVGAGDFARFGRIARAATIIPLGSAIALAIASAFAAGGVIDGLVGPLPTAQAAAAYLVLRCVSLIPNVLCGLAFTLFAAAGDTRLGFTLLVCMNAVHLPLLAVLALGWGTHRPLGIVGAGISSLCAETIAMGYALWVA